MAAGLGFLTLHDFRGGRNGADPLTSIPETQCAEAINVDWYRGMLARRRSGSIELTPPVHVALDTSAILSLIRFIPGRSEKQTELFAFDRAGLYARFIGGTGWIGGSPVPIDEAHGILHGVSFNGKLFLAGENTGHLLYVFEPAYDGIRAVGLLPPTAPPVITPSGTAGSITTSRFYKVRWTNRVGTVTTHRSEMSPQAGLSITSQTGWKIQRPADPFTATHWELYGAIAGGVYYLLQTIPMATTFVLDTIAPTSFPPPNAPLAPIEGAYTPAPGGKYLLVDEARLLIANTFTDASRVWWTPILNDASGDGNDERVNIAQRPWIDFDPGEAGEITGLGGPLFDSPYVFKFDRVYKMVRTGLALAAYRPVTVSKKCGAIHQRTIVQAEDETGMEAIYFLSRRGPFRVGIQGVQYCGRDIEDLWATVNLYAASGSDTNAAAHGLYHADLHQVWWWVPTGTSDVPNVKLVFDTRLGQFTQTDGVRGGWSQHTGPSARAWCSEMFADAIEPPPEPEKDNLHLKPYLSQAGSGGLPDEEPRIWMADHGYTDNDTGYIASVRSRGIVMSETVALHGGVLEGHVLVSPGVHSFVVSTLRDYGVEVRTSAPFAVTAVPPTMLGFPLPRVLLPVRDLAAVSCAVLQIEYADTPLSEIWELDQIVLRVRREEDR